MRILVVEDRGTVLYPLIEKLEALGHEVLPAFNVAQARAAWNGGKNEIACIIVDLNIPADARAREEIDQKDQSSSNKEWHELAGWIWLEQEGLVIKPPTKDVLKIVVFSGYQDVWQAQGCRENEYPWVRFIRKGAETAQNVRECVKAIVAA